MRVRPALNDVTDEKRHIMSLSNTPLLPYLLLIIVSTFKTKPRE